jgi:uncharacterized protein YndB with AHSA1/START domain
MAWKILLGLLVIVAAVLAFAAMKSDTFRIERSIVIQAPPEKVFALIDDLHEWPKWAPHDREDPSIKRTFGGAASGVGAASDWSGAGSTGKGRIEIVSAESPRLVTVNADWARPFVAHNVNTFTLGLEGGGTRVTWAMQGTNVFMMKLMSVFVSMDRMVGAHFESALANLKGAAEK